MTMTVVQFHLSARGSCIPILIVLLLLSWTDSYRHHPLYRLTYSLERCHQYDDTHKIHVGRYRHSKLIHVFAAVSLIGGHSNSASSATDTSVAITLVSTNITTTTPSHATQQSSAHSLKVRIQWFQSQIQRNNIQSFISLFKHYRDEVDITYYSLIDEYYIGPDDISYALTRLLPSMNRGMISTFCEQVLFFQHHSTYMLQVLDTQALTATMSSLNKWVVYY